MQKPWLISSNTEVEAKKTQNKSKNKSVYPSDYIGLEGSVDVVPLFGLGVYSYLFPTPSTRRHSTSGRYLGIISCLNVHPASLQSSATMSSQDPSSSTSNSTWLTGYTLLADYLNWMVAIEAHSFGDVDLRHRRRQEPDNLRHGGNLQAGSNADQQVRLFSIMVHQAFVKSVWQLFAKERNVGL